jgi:hydroxymethylpyrimidine/phosphomethylpyrimidine kinase
MNGMNVGQEAGFRQASVPIALTIAGSDSGGGAGIQADLKTFHQFGVFGTSVLVAITAQNTRGVRAVHAVPVEMVLAQMAALAEDLPPKAVKTGMLATRELVEVVADGIRRHGFPHYVLDPVMVATSGDRLLDREAERSVAERLVPLAALVTPNLHETRILVEREVRTPEDMEEAGKALVRMGAKAALVKGGHLDAAQVVDVLVTAGETRAFRHPKIETSSTHGTGCTLSAAVAAGLARGRPLQAAVAEALDFVHRAIAEAFGLGSGHGPLNHFVPAPR